MGKRKKSDRPVSKCLSCEFLDRVCCSPRRLMLITTLIKDPCETEHTVYSCSGFKEKSK